RSAAPDTVAWVPGGPTSAPAVSLLFRLVRHWCPARQPGFLTYDPPRMQKPPIIGIDLGTTNSCAAIVTADGSVKLIPYKGGDYNVPSVFAIDEKGNELIGHEAKRQWQLNPKNTVYGSKRLVGRSWSTDVVDEMRKIVQYSVRPGKKNDVVIDVAKKEFSLQEISSRILHKIRE